MRLAFLIVCVSLSAAAAAASEDSRPGALRARPAATRLALRLVDLPRVPQTTARFFDAPLPLQSDAALRIDDMTRRAENTLISAVESAQHLGSPYRTWLWVTPFSGQSASGAVYGAAIRFDLR